jgi:hypothetical protein
VRRSEDFDVRSAEGRDDADLGRTEHGPGRQHLPAGPDVLAAPPQVRAGGRRVADLDAFELWRATPSMDPFEALG